MTSDLALEKVCFSDYCLAHPYALLLLIPLIIILLAFLKKSFVKFQTKKEMEEYEKEKSKIRLFIIITRSIIFLLLVIALASPFALEQKTIPGDISLKILADNSSSFDMFDKNTAYDLKSKLEEKMPVTLKPIASAERSAIGDGILNNVQGDDNLLVVSDGNNNYGRDLGDMVLFASMLNATINMLDISPLKQDVGVRILGPREVIISTENEFRAKVEQIGPLPYQLKVKVDDSEIIADPDGNFKYTFNDEGYHAITAEITTNNDDFFKQNNIYYKAIKVVQRPKILFVSKKTSQLLRALIEIYNVRLEENIPEDITQYSAVILNDIGLEDLKDKTDALTKYVADKGNGLFVVGGENSYDKGSYKSSIFETILPVEVGSGEKGKDSDINIVVIMDISGTSGMGFSSGSVNSKLDVEKALTLNVLSSFRPEDKVAVLAFNDAAFMISPLSTFAEKEDLVDKIKKLQSGGGTLVFKALRRAEWLLERAEGGKYIIVISDGIDAVKSTALDVAQGATTKGIKTYTVGVGMDTDENFLKQLASKGNGLYFKPTESQNLRLVFSRPEEPEDKDKNPSLIVINTNHWITKNIELNAKITGYNTVVPKPAATSLVVTSNGKPVITVWRLGLGRVASLTTDDGNKWSGEMLSKDNSKLLIKTVNWAIGDTSRNKEFDVDIDDTSLGKPTDVNVVSNEMPSSKGLQFKKADVNKYTASFMSDKTGFHDILGAKVAVNYNDEYLELGLNPKLRELVVLTGGAVFKPDEIDRIIETIKTVSKRVKMQTADYRWPFVLAALLVLLGEIVARKLDENKNLFG